MMFHKPYKVAFIFYVLLMVCDRMVTGTITLLLTINKDVTAGHPIKTMTVMTEPPFIHCVQEEEEHTRVKQICQVQKNCKNVKYQAAERPLMQQ